MKIKDCARSKFPFAGEGVPEQSEGGVVENNFHYHATTPAASPPPLR